MRFIQAASPARTLTTLLAATAVLTTALGGCYRNAQRGAVIGAGGGAVVGGVIGAAKGSTAKGAIIGAAVGGAAGAIIGDIMDRQAADLKQNIKGATVERVGEGIEVTFASGLLYDFDSDVVKLEARRNLDELARSFKEYPGTDLLIVGHTDSVGTASYNQDLSARRAEAAKRYLVSRGVDAARIRATGRGESEPVAGNGSDEGRARNRRVEVAIYASEKMRQEAKQQAAMR
ncbi:MAG TPA: OmpA family protein [Gemmatimonadales bacterium]|nr:OmpA family protein [Gemmatimonadales bacterium]